MLASAENPDAILETFMTDHLPAGSEPGSEGIGASNAGNPADTAAAEPIF
jgi:hypothetical protein